MNTDLKTLVVTPMQEEFDFFRQGCVRRGFHAQDATLGRLSVVLLPELNVTLACGGVGKAQFALQTQHLLDIGRGWDWVVCAGVAGGLDENLRVGDVVVGTSTVEHDYNNKFNERPLPTFAGAPRAIAGLVRSASSFSSFKVHFGTIASGDEDIVELERKKSLHQATGALAVAWEGAGGARACAFSQVAFVELRGITDSADCNAPSDFEANLELAMGNVAILITSWLNCA